MNRGEIIAAVKDYLNRPNLSDTSMSTMIMAAEGEMRTVLREHPSNLRRTSMIQAAGEPIMPLPYDMAQILLLRDSTQTLEQFPADARVAAEASGIGYIVRGDCVELMSPPQADTEFFLDYYAQLKSLQGNTDTNWVATYHPDIYIYGVLRESAIFLKDDARLPLWGSEFTRRIDGLAGQGWNKNIATVPRIRFG